MKLKLIFVKLIAAFLFSIFFQNIQCQSLGSEIDKVYVFSPHLLTKKQTDEKVKPLDGFWNKVKSDTATYLPALRFELATDKHKPFFYFDGSSLLLLLSNTRSDKLLAGEAIAKCDINDIDNELYVRRLNGLAFDGVNITRAAIKILGVPNYTFFLTQHVMTFSREDCLSYCLLPLDSRLYLDTLLAMFKEQDTMGQETILYTLWLGYSCRGEQFIHNAITDHSLSQTIREAAFTMDSMSHTSFPVPEHFEYSSTHEIMEVRNEALKRFSDEALDELFSSSMAIRKKMKCDFVPMDKDGSEKPTIDHNGLAKQVVALNEFKTEKNRVDSLNITSNFKRKITISTIDKSFLKEDNPEIIALCLVYEETEADKKIILTIKYDKFKQQIISIVKN